jgi:hypothetical protein
MTMRNLPTWIVILIFTVVVMVSNAMSTVVLIKAVEDSARATICVQLQGPACPLLPQPKEEPKG